VKVHHTFAGLQTGCTGLHARLCNQLTIAVNRAMIHKTAGIVLHSFRYRETSIIARIFTRDLGLQSYLVPGVRKTRATIRQNLFQPLTLVDMVVFHKEKSGLQHIKEINCHESYASIPYDIMKSSVAIFLSEMLTKSLKERDPNPEMFDFIVSSLRFLDQAKGKTTDFHLVFLMQLSRYLGFQPRKNFDAAYCFFNLREGLFQPVFSGENECLDRDLSRLFHQLSNADFDQLDQMNIPISMRRSLLRKTIDYYRFHLSGFQEVRSHLVLEMTLN